MATPITYTEPADANTPVAGMTLTGGHPRIERGVEVVAFSVRVKGQQPILRIDTRPELAKLFCAYKAEAAAEEAAREAKWAAEKAEDEALVASMDAKADELRKSIPADHVEVKVTKSCSLDGYQMYDYEADGVRLALKDVTIHGWASAQRDGAMAPFAQTCVASISRADLDKIVADRAVVAAEKAEKESAEKARVDGAFAEARSTGKPVEIERRTERCNGSADECSLDLVITYAMPDGSRKNERQHTY